ncbi:hypothetical protein BDF22DRAFT_744239 [Syncephalis plumigaleata]|nr:hypothetical protein BDF22DRAFT_744239 [Syncephalis plumigaleata]
MKLSALSMMRGMLMPAVLLMYTVEMPVYTDAAPFLGIRFDDFGFTTKDTVVDAKPAVVATEPAVKLQTTTTTTTIKSQIIEQCISADMVAITFDDGPGQSTREVVNTLNSLGVKATFLVNGDNVGNLNTAEDQETLKYTYDSGHLIGSHTYSHADLSTLGEQAITTEMKDVDRLIKKVIVMKQLGYYVVTWNVDTNDWRHPHDPWASIQDFKIDSTITRINNGKRMVRLDECLGVPGYRN